MTRAYISLNGEWTFHGPNGSVEQVNIPHTWNGKDGQDGGNDYWRGTCTYEKNFRQPEFDSEKQRVYLEFQGVNSTADVEINGNLAVHHDGGYSTFRADITEMLQEENRLTVRVDNSTNDRVYPQKADFTFYGGIYRDVALIVVSQNHFDLDYFGGKGIKITPKLEKGCGKIHVETFVTGTGQWRFPFWMQRETRWRPERGRISFWTFPMPICGMVWKIPICTGLWPGW